MSYRKSIVSIQNISNFPDKKPVKKTKEFKVLHYSISEKLRALGHPVRITIVELLDAHNRLSTSEIQKTIELGQSQTASHLRILRNRKILDAEREGHSR